MIRLFNWISIITVSGVVLLISYLILSSISSPINDISGCYQQKAVAPIDRICFTAGGNYSQYSIDNNNSAPNLYNQGQWRRYSAEYNGDRTVAYTLNDYISQFDDRRELDITPYQTLFGRSLFVVGGDSFGNNDRLYIKINE